MSCALSPSVARCYGLARVARVWRSRASVLSRVKRRSRTRHRVALVRSAHVRTPNWQIISAGK